MKPTKTLTVIALAFLLTACAGSTKPAKPGLVVQPDSRLTQSCKRPVKLPEKELSQKEVETFWRKDRVALINCGVSKDALVRFYRKRDR